MYKGVRDDVADCGEDKANGGDYLYIPEYGRGIELRGNFA